MKRQPIYKDSSFTRRHPKLFMGVFTSFALLVFFSKPIYDTFISPPTLDARQLLESGHRSKMFKRD